ncbi:MAG: chemotaxis protein CheW [Candidatus Cyclobacteriaceae bacterium M2_1C_046]
METKEEVTGEVEQIDPDKQRQFIVFKLGEEEYAIPIENVKEVTITPLISKMPKTPSFIKGVASIRGEVIAILDLESRFNINKGLKLPTKDSENSYTMVIDAKDYSLGIITKQMPHTLKLGDSQIDVAAHIIKRAKVQSEFIEGLGKVAGKFVIILNMNKLLNDKEIQFLTNVKSGSDE